MKFNIIKLCVLIMLATQSQSVLSKEKLTFIIGVEKFAQNLPYSEIKKGKYIGFNRELLDKFAKSKGYKFTYKATPIKRLFSDFLKGKIDFKYPDNPHWFDLKNNNAAIVYSFPVVKFIDGVIVKPSNINKGVNSLKKLGTIRGFTPYAYLDQIIAGNIKVQESGKLEILLKKTMANRVDGAYVNIATSRYYLSLDSKTENALVYDPSLPHSKSERYLSSINYPEIIKEFNAFLIENKVEIDGMKDKAKVEKGID